MSRTKKESNSSSPVKKYLSFSGGSGQITWYDKNAPEDERKKSVDELSFILLDTKSSITGYNEASSKSISSNLLSPFSVGKEEFEIRLGGNIIKKGIWKDIKKELESTVKGCKFTTNIFALADLGDGLEVVRLELNGSSLSPWINFSGKLGNEIYDKVITITKGQLCTRKDGETVAVSDAELKKIVAAIEKNPLAPRPVMFYESAFSDEDLTEEQADEATKADEELQKYFDSVGVSAGSEESEEKEDLSSNTSPKPAFQTGGDKKPDDLPF